MKPRKIWSVIAALFAAGAVTFAIFESQRAALARTNSALATQSRDAAGRQLKLAEARLKAAELAAARRKDIVANDAKQKRSSAQRDGSKASDDPAAETSRAPWFTTTRDPRYIAATNPKVRALSLQMQDTGDHFAGPILRKLNISPDRVEKFKEIGMANAIEHKNILALGLSKEETNKLIAANAAETDAQPRALFTPEEFAAWNQFVKDRSLGAGGRTVDGLVIDAAKRAYLSDSPLTLEQGQQLTHILAANIDRERLKSVPLLSALNLEAVIAQASAAGLGPTQIAGLRSAVENAQRDRQIAALIDAVVQRYPGAKRPTIPSPTSLPR